MTTTPMADQPAGGTPAGEPTAVLPAATTPAGPPRSGPSPVGRALTVVGITLGAAALLSGVLQLGSSMAARTTSADAVLAATDVVEVVADGDVRVAVGMSDDLQVTRTAVAGWGGPRYEVTTGADRTTLRHTCEGLGFLRCRADLEVRVPEGTHVVVRTSDGDTRVSGRVGNVEVQAGDGAVEVVRTLGTVDVQATDGDVAVRDVWGDVQVRVSDGRVRVADTVGDVHVRSRDGATRVQGVEGDVEVVASDGSVDVSDVVGSLTASAADGDVVATGVQEDVRIETRDGDITVYGTGDPVALTIDSTGEQRVGAPTDPAAPVSVQLTAVDGDVAYLAPDAP